jgi:raffinose/stachyose/melibiose transport system substrate-binding protein
MKKKLPMSLVSIVLSASMLAACGGNGKTSGGSNSSARPSEGEQTAALQKEATLKYLTWNYADTTNSTDALIKDLNDKFQIKLDMQNVPTDQYATAFKSKLAAKDMPDMVWIHSLDRKLYSAAENAQLDESTFADISDLKVLADYDQAVVADKKRNGKLFYIPTTTNVLGVIYNKKVFADNGLSVPTNIDEFLAVCDKLKAVGVAPIAGSFKDAWTTQIIPFIAFGQYINQKDMSIRTKLADGSMKYSDIKDDLKKVVELPTQWANKGYFSKDYLGTDANAAAALVGTGKAAMLINGTWQYKAVQDADPNAQIGFFPLPLNAKGEKMAIPTTAENGLAISGSTKNLAAAKQAMEYFLSAQNQEKYVADTNGIPTNTKVKVSSPFVQEVVASFSKGVVQPDFWFSNGYYMPAGASYEKDKELQDLLANGITFDQYLAHIDDAAAKALKK